jgi:hypothetical protein
MAEKVKGFEEFMNKFSSIKIDILSNMSNNNYSNEYWKYLGDRNTGIWSRNLDEIITSKVYIKMPNDIKKSISKIIVSNILNITEYPVLKQVQNSRFSNCWFFKRSDQSFFGPTNWDMCVQLYEDEWFLVNIGSGDGNFNFWYLCDGLDGLKKLIEDKKLN